MNLSNLSWSHLKTFVDTINVTPLLNYVEYWDKYFIWLQYQGVIMSCDLSKGSDICDEFENYYKPYINIKVSPEGNEIQSVESSVYISALDWDSAGNPTYIGKARSGVLKSESGWQIKKLIYDSSGNVVELLWCEGSQNFSKIWDNRESYTYS